MKRFAVKQLLRLKLLLTSRASADRLIHREADRSLAVLSGLSETDRARPVRVPAMMGVDEDMRDWSLYQVLEHNAIVNRAFTNIIHCLVQGHNITGMLDPKKGVMPTAQPGPQAVDAFKTSVQSHFAMLGTAQKLRGTAKHPHPICGPLNAHGWHAFFGIHLALHRAQMQAIRTQLTGPPEPPNRYSVTRRLMTGLASTRPERNASTL